MGRKKSNLGRISKEARHAKLYRKKKAQNEGELSQKIEPISHALHEQKNCSERDFCFDSLAGEPTDVCDESHDEKFAKLPKARRQRLATNRLQRSLLRDPEDDEQRKKRLRNDRIRTAATRYLQNEVENKQRLSIDQIKHAILRYLDDDIKRDQRLFRFRIRYAVSKYLNDIKCEQDANCLINSPTKQDQHVIYKQNTIASNAMTLGDNTEDVTFVKKRPAECSDQLITAEIKQEPSQRPSRRAAKLAVQKIQNTVRNLFLPSTAETVVEEEPSFTRARYPAARAKPKPKTRKNPAKKVCEEKIRQVSHVLPEDIELMMECHEELLSSVQMSFLVQAQNTYNTVMQKLRLLKATNVRIICEKTDEVEAPAILPFISPPSKVIVSTANIRSPNLVTLSAASAGQSPSTITVVPVRLLTVHPPGTGKQLRTTSPTVSLTATSVQ